MKKLNDVEVDYVQILAFARKNSEKGRRNQLSAKYAPVDFHFRFALNKFVEKRSIRDSVKSAFYQTDCDISPDMSIIMQGFLRLVGYPEAKKMFWHYLTGRGAELEVNTTEVFNDDHNLKTFAFSSVRDWLARSTDANTGQSLNRLTGVHSVNFKDSQYSTEKWRLAFGAINIKWEKVGQTINIWFEDVYDWNPNDFKRPDQCIHMAMARAKEYGARKFRYHGTKLRFDEANFLKSPVLKNEYQ